MVGERAAGDEDGQRAIGYTHTPARRRAHVNAHRVRAVARAFSQVVSTSRCRLAAYGGPDAMASGRFRLLPAYGGPDTMASDMRVGRRQV